MAFDVGLIAFDMLNMCPERGPPMG